MLYEIIKALDDPNGITEDMWFKILSIVDSEQSPQIRSQCFGGRYYITELQRNRLRYVIPFLYGEETANIESRPVLALPPHTEIIHPIGIRCGRCKGPFHPATGHAFSVTIVACGPCYGRFAAWQLQKAGWKPLTTKQLNRINRKKAKIEKQAQRAAKYKAKEDAKKIAEHEGLYGRPKEIQSARSIELPQNDPMKLLNFLG